MPQVAEYPGRSSAVSPEQGGELDRRTRQRHIGHAGLIPSHGHMAEWQVLRDGLLEREGTGEVKEVYEEGGRRGMAAFD